MEMSLSKLSSGSWWWTGKPDMLLSPRSQRVRHNWAIKLTELKGKIYPWARWLVLLCNTSSGLKTVSLKDCCHNNSEFKKKHLMWLRGSNAGKKQCVLFSSLRAWDSFLLLKGLRLLINLPKNELSHCFFDDLLFLYSSFSLLNSRFVFSISITTAYCIHSQLSKCLKFLKIIYKVYIFSLCSINSGKFFFNGKLGSSPVV